MSRRPERTDSEKVEILAFAAAQTDKAAAERFDVSVRTLNRWRKTSTPAVVAKARAALDSKTRARPIPPNATNRTRDERVDLALDRTLDWIAECLVPAEDGAPPVVSDKMITSVTGAMKALYEVKVTREILDARNSGQGASAGTADFPLPETGEDGSLPALAGHIQRQRLDS